MAALGVMTDVTNPVSGDLVSILLTWGPGGIVLILVLTGLLEPKRTLDRVVADRDLWKDAFMKEQEAHQKTREALTKSEERSDASIEAARTTASILEELDHRRRTHRSEN